jgi:hypothetical protein
MVLIDLPKDGIKVAVGFAFMVGFILHGQKMGVTQK